MQGDALPSTVKRVVLVGSTGAGKSSAANLLLGRKYWNEGPFVVSGKSHACTYAIETRTYETQRGGLEVVDTPGLGDRPKQHENESEEDYKIRANEGSTKYFKDISQELHDRGGLVLYVHKVDRGANYHHVKALDIVLHDAFVTCAGLIITGGFNPRTIQRYNDNCKRSKEAVKERLAAVQEYEAELQMLRQEVEKEAKVNFAFVHGVDSSAMPGHPAHTASLLRRIQDHKHPGLDKGVAILWESLLQNGISKTDDARAREVQWRRADETITAKENEKFWLEDAIRNCDIVISSSTMSAACDSWLWAVGLPGLGTGVAFLMYVPAQYAKNVYIRNMKRNEEEINKLKVSKKAWETSPNGRSAEELQSEVDRLKSLVFLR